MAFGGEWKRRARHAAGPLFGCLLVAYFVHHAIHGDRGALAWRELDRRIAEAEAERDTTRAAREALERRVALLRPDSLDPDMMEELGRRLLNFAHPDDLVIPLDRRR